MKNVLFLFLSLIASVSAFAGAVEDFQSGEKIIGCIADKSKVQNLQKLTSLDGLKAGFSLEVAIMTGDEMYPVTRRSMISITTSEKVFGTPSVGNWMGDPGDITFVFKGLTLPTDEAVENSSIVLEVVSSTTNRPWAGVTLTIQKKGVDWLRAKLDCQNLSPANWIY